MKIDQATTIARPYAAAAFAAALSEEKCAEWGMMLDAAAAITQDAAVKVLLARPGIEPLRLYRFYSEVLASMLNAESSRFLELLAQYRRLSVLPEIARLFQARRNVFEKKMTVHVLSAIPLKKSYCDELSNKLAQRLEHQIELVCEVDSALMGGVIVKVGDKVMDGSVRSKLTRMIEYISGKLLG